MTTLPITSIIVNRDERQRRALVGIEELATSIAARGLINPITVTREGVLIAGERRLTAVKSLGWPTIPVRYMDDLSHDEQLLVELEENTKRLDITWQEKVRAFAKYHALQGDREPGWTLDRCADALAVDKRDIVDALNIHRELEAGNPHVVNADRYSVARGVVRRQQQRREAALVEQIALVEEPEAAPEGEAHVIPEAAVASEVPLFHADFHQWLLTYTGPKFNLIHCDFPYGINFGAQKGQNSANIERYEDSFDTYKACLESLERAPIADSAHLIFWFSPVHYEFTKLRLIKMGWVIDPFPFVWAKSDNSGLLPDPNRGGRRTYEMAFLGTRGDRHIVKPVALHWHGARGEAVHASVKPRALFEHLLRMYVDETTVMLDPTCGSGNALRIGANLGAKRVMGLEVNETYWRDAVRLWGK